VFEKLKLADFVKWGCLRHLFRHYRDFLCHFQRHCGIVHFVKAVGHVKAERLLLHRNKVYGDLLKRLNEIQSCGILYLGKKLIR
jgi:hypothetical protein